MHSSSALCLSFSPHAAPTALYALSLHDALPIWEGLVRGRELRLERLEDLQLERLFIHHGRRRLGGRRRRGSRRRGGSRPARFLAGESSDQLLLLLQLLLDSSELFLQQVEFRADLLLAGPLCLGAGGAGCSREEQGEEQGRAVSDAETRSHRLLHSAEGGRMSDDAGIPARTTRGGREELTNDQTRQGGTRLSIMPPSVPRMRVSAPRDALRRTARTARKRLPRAAGRGATRAP